MAINYKILGQAAPSATTDTTLYTVPAATQAVVSAIVIANRSASQVTYRVAARPGGASLENQHYIAFDVVVASSDSTTLNLGVTLNATDVITVRASTGDLTFSAFGSEITA
jgi:hypothetical protein